MEDPQVWFELLVRHADALRRAGVVRIRLGAAEVDFAPRYEGSPASAPVSSEHPDPLLDPATFGGRVPVYPRES